MWSLSLSSVVPCRVSFSRFHGSPLKRERLPGRRSSGERKLVSTATCAGGTKPRWILQTPSAVTPHDAGLRGSYDREAAQYDARRYESAEGRLFSELELTVLRSWLPLAPGARILDVPAGTGRLTVALAESGATLVGADISANMLKVAASKRKDVHEGHVHLIQGSGAQLPFADDTFDAVVSFKFFHLIPNDRKPAFIREMTRVLKPSATLVAEFNSPVLRWGSGGTALLPAEETPRRHANEVSVSRSGSPVV